MKKPVVALLLVFCLLPFSAALSGQVVEEVHEFHIYPNVASTPLKLQWLTAQQNSRLTVVAPPSLGSLEAGRYTPSAEFWRAGVDRVSLKEAGIANSPVYTLLLTALVPNFHIHQIPMSLADFEECQNPRCLPAWWDDLDPHGLLSVNGASPLSGERSLSFQIPYSGEIGHIRENPFPLGGGGGTGAGGSGTHQVEPPDYNFQDATAVIASLGELEIQIRMPDPQLGSGSETAGYHMRIAAPNNPSCLTCATPWRLMPFRHPIQTEVWSGDKVTGPYASFPRPRGVRFTVQPAGQEATVDRLEGDFDAWGLELGVLRSNGIEGLSGQYDDFVTWREIYRYRPLGMIADGFEGGGHPGWSFEGPVVFTSDEALSGKAVAEIDLLPLVHDRAETEDALLIDESPIEASLMTAMMRIDTSALTFANGSSMEILRASAGDTVDSDLRIALVLQRRYDQLRVQLVAVDDHQSGLHVTPWVSLTDGTTDLIVQWRRAEPGRENGEMRLWSKGTLIAEKHGMNNSGQTIESVAYGVHNLTLPDRRLGGPGTIKIDDVAAFAKR